MLTIFNDLVLIKRFFQMYWLKPFDAVNDAANASSLHNLGWPAGDTLEVGGGDGVFSFIAHGGRFRFGDDRYSQADPRKTGDIYDIYSTDKGLKVMRGASIRYDLGVDLKLSHIYKARETMMYRHLISSVPEKIGIKDRSFSAIFLYTFHGLTDYKNTLKEMRRVIKDDGSLMMTAVNSRVRDYFVCRKFADIFDAAGLKGLARYFAGLDGGRSEEIGGIFAKNLDEWRALFKEAGFSIEGATSQVSWLQWVIYDTQTRPFLKALVSFDHAIEGTVLKRIIKSVWMLFWFPVVCASYAFFAIPRKISPDSEPRGVFFTFKLKPV